MAKTKTTKPKTEKPAKPVKPRGKPGRPPKLPGQKLSEPFSIRVSPDCEARIQARVTVDPPVNFRQAAQSILEEHA